MVSAGLPSTSAIRAIVAADRCRYAVATSDLSAVDERLEVGDLEAGLEPFAPMEPGVPQVPLVRGRRRSCERRAPLIVRPSPTARRTRPSAPSHPTTPPARWRRRTPRRAPTGSSTMTSPQPADPCSAAVGPGEPLGRRRRGLVGDHPVVALGQANVGQPLAGEAFDVVQERGGRREDLPVAGPTGALAVRAVGRDLAHVAAQAPDDRVVQPVDALVVTLEPAGPLEIAVHDDAPHVVDAELVRDDPRCGRTGSRAS